MTGSPRIVILCGGNSPESDVSRVSAAAVSDVLCQYYDAVKLDLGDDSLPAGLDPARDVIFPVMHGGWGEGGGLQREMESAGLVYCGCNSAASDLCMNKCAAKRCVEQTAFDLARDAVLSDLEDAPAWVGDAHWILKPNASGSSDRLFHGGGTEDLARLWADLQPGTTWLLEERITGREMSIGLLNGEPLGIVEIRPRGGLYDLAHKYTAGSTEYLCPAPLTPELTARAQQAAREAWKALGCTDFARIDFFVTEDNRLVFLEANTIPGLTPLSLYPKSASAHGMDFPATVRAMVAPALRRWAEKRKEVNCA